MAKVLLVEDDSELACMIKTCLSFDHYSVETAKNGDDAIALLRGFSYDIVLLDWGLPGKSGLQICEQFRDAGGITPILMITARNDLSDKEQGLDGGADDYLTKPFEMKELSARVRALLRRSSGQFSRKQLQYADLIIQPENFCVTRAGVDLILSAKEFAILELFMRHPQQVFSVDSLISHVWSHDDETSHESVRQHIMNLRRKLESVNITPIIETVRGVGYRLRSTVPRTISE